MQDRYLVVAILVILAICCLGGYVAISGYLISNPPSLSALATGVAATPIVIAVSTDTPAAARTVAAAPPSATAPPVPSPLGAFETIAAASTTQQAPTRAPTAGKPASPPTVAPSSVSQACTGYAFCPKSGPPDFSLAVGDNPCPANYIIGRVVDKNGNGMPNMQIRYKLVSTGEVDIAVTKGLPDLPGKYNISTGQTGGAWTIWLTDAGNQVSPEFNIVTSRYNGSGNCPTRVDFVQQR